MVLDGTSSMHYLFAKIWGFVNIDLLESILLLFNAFIELSFCILDYLITDFYESSFFFKTNFYYFYMPDYFFNNL